MDRDTLAREIYKVSYENLSAFGKHHVDMLLGNSGVVAEKIDVTLPDERVVRLSRENADLWEENTQLKNEIEELRNELEEVYSRRNSGKR